MNLQQLISLLGAILILAAYVAHQVGWMDSGRARYNLLNLAGSILLGYVAIAGRQYGFILLEIVWALVSLYALSRLVGGQA